MEGYYAESKEEALKKALELIPEGSSVGWGGSMSIKERGFWTLSVQEIIRFTTGISARRRRRRERLSSRFLTATISFAAPTPSQRTGSLSM